MEKRKVRNDLLFSIFISLLYQILLTISSSYFFLYIYSFFRYIKFKDFLKKFKCELNFKPVVKAIILNLSFKLHLLFIVTN